MLRRFTELPNGKADKKMTLRAVLMQQMENPALTLNQQVELRCRAARELEDTGDYEAACEMLGEIWQGVGVRPQLEGLAADTSAEALLRVGVLTGWLGHTSQIKDAQERAKNLISESERIFASLAYMKKRLEAQTELAYCYWREGAYDEARVILGGVLAQLLTDGELKSKAVLRSAIVERSSNRYNDALRILTESASLFERIHNQTIKGGYHNELGLVLKNLAASEKREDYLDRAFVEYAAASYHFEQADHKYYRANVENNLGFLYYKAGRFTDAHEHLDHARRLLVSLKDTGTVAQVDETRARVFLAQERRTEAERAARSAVATLERGGRQSLLAEALTTHGAALVRLEQYDRARFTLFRAIEVAHQSGALNDAGIAALTVVEELGEHLSAEEMQAVYERAYQWLSTSQHQETLRRLLVASKRIFGAARTAHKGTSADEPETTETEGNFRELMKGYENKLIRQALLKGGGSVTQAARLLGLSHQALNYILEHRHESLLLDRLPVQKRRRSLVKDRRDQ
jgi:tetratricopeptide (TPR) repeat protein